MTAPVAMRYSDVFAALDAADVRYVIVGGVAVNFHGYPRPFEELVDASQSVAVGDVLVRIASRDHMIAMKRAAGRPRDLEDIARLEVDP